MTLKSVKRRGWARVKQHLQADKIVETLEKLHLRISERFPSSGLAVVCAELVGTARVTAQRSQSLSRPFLALRILAGLALAVAIYGQGYAILSLDFVGFLDRRNPLQLTQALEAAANLVILAGAAVWFLVSLEDRVKRRQVLRHLHELRAFAHVIDMHQLTKDPMVVRDDHQSTAASPKRDLTPFQLSRYLDYCSEMLALTSKLAALYGEGTRDTQITATVNEIENLSTNLGRKIWQKIMIINNNAVSAGDMPRPQS